MDKYIMLGVGISTTVIGIGVVTYIRLLKKKIRKYVFRNEKIKRYFKGER